MGKTHFVQAISQLITTRNCHKTRRGLLPPLLDFTRICCVRSAGAKHLKAVNTSLLVKDLRINNKREIKQSPGIQTGSSVRIYLYVVNSTCLMVFFVTLFAAPRKVNHNSYSLRWTPAISVIREDT